jgi:hypothetical protein
MTVQTRLDIDNVNLVVSGDTFVREDETISQIIGRAVPMLHNTVVARNGAQWLPLQVVDPAGVPAICTCGAFGTTLAVMQGITDGDFGIEVDGVHLHVTGCDFSDIDAPSDQPARLVCGTNGSVIGDWDGVANGAFGMTVNGIARTFTGLDFNTVAVTTFEQCASIIDDATMRVGVHCTYNRALNVFAFETVLTGRNASLTALIAAGGTDISGVNAHLFLNGDVAVPVAGTGGIGATVESVINEQAAGRFTARWDAAANAYVFISPTVGEESAIGPLTDTGGAGTDISGATRLNGLTAVAVLTPATGMDDVNLPAGIYIGEDITAAAIAAANIPNCPILVGGTATINSTELVFEGGLTLATQIPTLHKPIGDVLLGIGLTPETCIDIAGHENV